MVLMQQETVVPSGPFSEAPRHLILLTQTKGGPCSSWEEVTTSANRFSPIQPHSSSAHSSPRHTCYSEKSEPTLRPRSGPRLPHSFPLGTVPRSELGLFSWISGLLGTGSLALRVINVPLLGQQFSLQQTESPILKAYFKLDVPMTYSGALPHVVHF